VGSVVDRFWTDAAYTAVDAVSTSRERIKGTVNVETGYYRGSTWK
jgi:hypothetical protein